MTLVGLDLRELWMSFRLLLVVGALVAGGLAAVLFSMLVPRVGSASVAYSVSLAVASIVAAAVAAYSVASERWNGSSAWLVVRAVSRGSLLVAWLAAFVPPVLVGLSLSALVAWVAIVTEPAFTSTAPVFVVAVAAAGVGAFVAISLGALFGILLTPRFAAWLAGLLSSAAAVATLLAPAGTPLPTGGFLVLADVAAGGRPVSFALQSIGLGLVAIALLVGAAATFLQRADL